MESRKENTHPLASDVSGFPSPPCQLVSCVQGPPANTDASTRRRLTSRMLRKFRLRDGVGHVETGVQRSRARDGVAGSTSLFLPRGVGQVRRPARWAERKAPIREVDETAQARCVLAHVHIRDKGSGIKARAIGRTPIKRQYKAQSQTRHSKGFYRNVCAVRLACRARVPSRSLARRKATANVRRAATSLCRCEYEKRREVEGGP